MSMYTRPLFMEAPPESKHPGQTNRNTEQNTQWGVNMYIYKLTQIYLIADRGG